MSIEQQHTSFTQLTHTLSALPVFPYLKLTGFASEGIAWEKINPTTTTLGADGLAKRVKKPVLYSGTFSLQPNSASREVLDNLISVTTPVFGKSTLDYTLILTVENVVTGMKYVYSGGSIEEADAGDSANLDDGEQTKTYKVTFTDRVALPL